MDIHEAIIPVRLKRCGVETRLIVQNETSSPAHHSSVDAIQGALAKALEWNEALLSGAASSMTQIAKREEVTQRYIAHLVKLAFLAPDIMQRIAEGDIPPDLSLDHLKTGFPLDWDAQRKTLGFKG